MQGQKVLIVGGQGPVSAPVARLLSADNDVYIMSRFTNPEAKKKLEASGFSCIAQDLLEPFDTLPNDFDYVYYTAIPYYYVYSPRGQWPDSYDKYADATGRLLSHCRSAKGFVFASTISAYDPPGGDTPVPETWRFGIHNRSEYSFTKVANEAVVSYLSRSLDIPVTIIRIGSASGIDGGPMLKRLACIVEGRPILLHPDKPTYLRPIFEPDAARLGVAALEAGRVPPLVVNWCGDDIVSAEEYCSYMGELIGKEPIFEYTPEAYTALVPDTTLMNEVLGRCEVRWRDGCRMLVEQCYPDLLKK